MFLVAAKIGSKFLLSGAKFCKTAFKFFQGFAVIPLFLKLFHAMAPL